MLPAHGSAAVCAAADWPAGAVLATEILQKPDFIASHATGQRQTRVDFELGSDLDARISVPCGTP
jgi:hypothetical protein